MIAGRHTRVTALVTVVLLLLPTVPIGAQIYFADDFEDPEASAAKWEVVGGDWQVGDGVYHQLGTSGPWQAAMVAADHWNDQWQEYTIEFDVRILTEGDAPVNVLFRVQDPVPVVWDDRNGPDTHMYRWIVNGWTNTESRPYAYSEGTATMLAQTDNTLEVGAWHHIKLVVTATGMAGYVNDVELFTVQHAAWTTGRVGVQAYSGVMDFDDLVIYGPLGLVGAASLAPENGAADVSRETALSWTPGCCADTHDVYLGTSFDDVNDASRGDPRDVLVSQGQNATTYDPGRLDLGQTYYWRVDEVNAPPDSTIFRGEVWSFETEPLGYPIETVSVTASSFAEDAEPENVINGSGLDENDLHSGSSADMWLSAEDGEQPTYIEFDFGRVYKLYELLVWNYNVEFEYLLGYGFKDVTITYSENGIDWTTWGDFEFAQGTSAAGYGANTAIDFNGTAAQMVRLTVNSDWAARGTQYGLSEVRFLHIPTQARAPEPADGDNQVSLDTALTWRAGRGAAEHDVYLGMEADALDLAGAVTETTFTPTDLQLGTTYYWKVDEVNEAEAVSVWEGFLWSFVTQEFVTVDDFESYDDEDHRIYNTWVDGWINGTSSTVGYYEAPFVEMSIVHGGRQAMPLEYVNTASPYYSEAEYGAGDADWTTGGADTLRLYVWGQADNDADTFYVALEDSAGNTAVVAYPDTAILTTEAWQEWAIGFDEFSGVDMTAVRTVWVGVGDRDAPSAGGSGVVFVDDVQFGNPAGD